ncbi:hypothetical protein [Natronorarus salvus]|uniref:hypothetical protein n=1 Tax=Natronorarus salvus TaxID=3117733 RepID=UPI002F2682E6
MLNTRPSVSIDAISVHDGTEVRYDLSYSRRFGRFLTGVDPYVRYSEDVSAVPESILVVPLLTTLCPLAWITGTEVSVGRVDSRVLRSLSALQRAYADQYPDAPFDRVEPIRYETVVNTRSPRTERAVGVLFTGGVDSTTTYLNHREEEPHLITVRKERETRENTWRKRSTMIDAFAEENGLTAHYVETNVKSMVDKFTVNLYFRHLLNDSWDRTMYFGIGYPGLTAPITHNEGITRIYQSADYMPHEGFPNSAQPRLVDTLRWSGTAVESDAVGTTRQEKIELIGEYFAGRETAWEISSCDEGGEDSLSCNRCGTCLHTITGFLVAGHDPEEYGFEVDERTFDRIRSHVEGERFTADSVKARFWIEMQERVDPDRVDLPYDGVNEFLEWFADATISEELSHPLPIHEPNYTASLKRRLCTKLPYPFDSVATELYLTYVLDGSVAERASARPKR